MTSTSRYILGEAFDSDLNEMVLNFKKDLRVNEEIFIWEGIAAAYATYEALITPSAEELREVFSALLQMSMGTIKEVLETETFQHLTRIKRELLLEIWAKVPEEVVFMRGEE